MHAKQTQREHGDRVARVDCERVDREEGAGDRRERRREPVHVVEEVERVRHPDEPEDADHRPDDRVRDDLDAHAGREHERGSRELRADLRDRREAEDIVEQARGEEDRAAADDACELPAGRDQTRRERDADGDEQPGHDPGPAEQRRRAGVPAVGPRRSDDDPRGRGAQQEPDRQEAGRKSGERGRGDRHGAARLRRAVRAARSTDFSLTKGC